MENEDEIKTVVIATLNCEKGLFIIAQDAKAFNTLELNFTEKFAPTVEYLLRILRKGFGWIEQDRGNKPVPNTRCYHNKGGYCAQPTMKKIRCNENQRVICKVYQKKYDIPIMVNYVIIEKVGQSKGL